MRSGNPALNDNTFLDIGSGRVVDSNQSMTLNGTVNKTGLLLLLIMISASYAWSRFTGPESASAIMPLLLIGAIGGLVFALITIFKKTWAPVTAPIYALLEGLFLGGLSAMLEARYPGIVVQAVGLTFGTLGALLMAYRSGLIRAT
ncbi:MAG: Bax inhibitor-1/YccA family protein, partial [Arenimonas sp.]